MPHDIRARHGVIEKRARQQLARFVVEYHLLAQRLADTLHGTTFKLTHDDQRIDHAAHVVDRPVAIDLDGARLRIDLDLADVATIGPRRIGH